MVGCKGILGDRILAEKGAVKRKERADWIAVARKFLIAGGIAKVKVDRLADELEITRGSFYWFFKGREELFDALLKDWEDTNSGPLLDAINSASGAREKYLALIRTWLEEKAFSPRYDSAIRDWARTSPKVAKVVRAVDEKRILAITEIYRDFGYDEDEALVRGRITYFHQVGYYALHFKESLEERKRWTPLYFKALTGKTY